MPRPTAAQLAYGSATVVVSTIAMLLLSQTSTGIGVAVISAAALALGLLVALTVPLPRRRGRHAARRGGSGCLPGARAPDRLGGPPRPPLTGHRRGRPPPTGVGHPRVPSYEGIRLRSR
ncbi:hypothetical protein EF912_09855 [Streptomyces sp. WAC07061]|uniref:hypothetical protein n=1 Tax=Streptomyces sp. WAC07061 TaxID=2487410 RepID=UPI000F766E44|nr:hypothetical protein [Streptomyces sp. WAC07061]RSS60478.1 hypothetical protein EF912_09855 [Streptomyces sp. WAC07061]